MARISVSASSQTGLVRDHNEDVILVLHQFVRDNQINTSAYLAPDDRYVVAVCDGLGGQNAGEVASMDAAEQFSKRVDTLKPGMSTSQLLRVLDKWAKDEHAYLIDAGRDDSLMQGMGTTMVCLLFYEGHICWLNCGDSRLYRKRKGVLCQLSTDHSLNQLTHNDEDSHIVFNCLGGGGSEAYFDIADITDEVCEGDVFLLCSDGLTDMLSDDRIEEIMNNSCDAATLANEAVASGGHDNVSVCLLTLDKL